MRKLSRLSAQLHDKTISSEIDWKLSEGSLPATARFGEGSISMNYSTRDDTIDIIISIFNSEGRVVTRFSDVDLANSDFSPPASSPGWFSYLDEIIQAAKRKESGADQVIDGILSELEGYDPF